MVASKCLHRYSTPDSIQCLYFIAPESSHLTLLARQPKSIHETQSSSDSASSISTCYTKMSTDMENDDGQVDAREVAENCGSQRHDQGDEAGLLRRFGLKATEAEDKSECTVFGRSEKQGGPVSILPDSWLDLIPDRSWSGKWRSPRHSRQTLLVVR